MKKIISISVIALFAMIPTFGWAAFDGVQSGNRDPHVNQTVPENTSTTTYVTTRSGTTDNGLSGDHGFQRAGAGVESIVTSQEPKFNVTQITEGDGEEVAALSFVKGAYNDAITKINKVYNLKAETSGKFNLNTTWDGDNIDVKKVTLITVNQEFEDEDDGGDSTTIGGNDTVPERLVEDSRCPAGYLRDTLYSTSGDFMCVAWPLISCNYYQDWSGTGINCNEKTVKAWWSYLPNLEFCYNYYRDENNNKIYGQCGLGNDSSHMTLK